jgi:CheY-like chemotaxis protein
MINKIAILVVDDEVTYCDVIADILETYGFTTHIAYSAAGALVLLDSVTPDLVLLDVMMPEIDGLTMLKQLRTESDWTEIPVIVASAKVLPEDVSAAFDAGADVFLPKPFTAKELRTALREFVAVPDTGSLEFAA